MGVHHLPHVSQHACSASAGTGREAQCCEVSEVSQPHAVRHSLRPRCGACLRQVHNTQPRCTTRPGRAQVVSVGLGKKKEDSEEVVKPNVTPGQTVMYSKYSGTEFEVGLVWSGVGREERGWGGSCCKAEALLACNSFTCVLARRGDWLSAPGVQMGVSLCCCTLRWGRGFKVSGIQPTPHTHPPPHRRRRVTIHSLWCGRRTFWPRCLKHSWTGRGGSFLDSYAFCSRCKMCGPCNAGVRSAPNPPPLCVTMGSIEYGSGRQHSTIQLAL